LCERLVGVCVAAIALGEDHVEGDDGRARGPDARYETCDNVTPPRPLSVLRQAALVNVDDHDSASR
jgi:hypothetical protein